MMLQFPEILKRTGQQANEKEEKMKNCTANDQKTLLKSDSRMTERG